jgi:hypothetical protein
MRCLTGAHLTATSLDCSVIESTGFEYFGQVRRAAFVDARRQITYTSRDFVYFALGLSGRHVTACTHGCARCGMLRHLVTGSAIIDEAHKQNLRAYVHAPGLQHAREALRAGVDGLVHSVVSDPLDDEFIALKKKSSRVCYDARSLQRFF